MVDKTKKKEEISDFEKNLYQLFLPLVRLVPMKELEVKLIQADCEEDIDIYLSRYFFYAIFVPILFIFCGGLLLILTKNTQYLTNLVIFCVFSFFGVLVYAMLKPYVDVGNKVAAIKNNLALAILGMSSVAESGAPPEAMFHTTSFESQTPYIAKEFGKITNFLDNLGLSLLEAIDEVCKVTPSLELKKFLTELKSNLEAGGSLPQFMKKKADHAQFIYHLMLNNMNKRAETFGDIYSAVVIAGPLFLFSTVMLLGMMGGGGFGGMSLSALLAIGVFIAVPVINLGFMFVLQLVS